MRIHREGIPFLIITLIAGVILAVILFFFQVAALIFWASIISLVVLFLFFLQFFRNPLREVIENEQQVIAPADGKVVVIEKTEETEYLKEDRIQVSIFMSPVNVHSNKNPVSGKVKFMKYHPGKYLVAWHPKSSTMNERTTVVVEALNGVDILFRQIAGAMARRIKYYVKEGDQVKQGEEFGFIKFGSRVDLYLPLDATILVELGQKTVAGKTVVAEFPAK